MTLASVAGDAAIPPGLPLRSCERCLRSTTRGILQPGWRHQHRTQRDWPRSRRAFARSRSATSAPTPALTPPGGSCWATSATPGRCAARRTAPACARARRAAAPTSSSAPTPATWIALRRGELSGIDAFGQRRLYARGNLDLAIAFEGLFRLEDGRQPLLRIHDVHLPGRRDLDADDGRGLRRPAAARPRRREELVLRRRGRALAALPRPRARPARLRRVLQARDRAVHGALVRRDRAGDDGRAGHRARARRRQLDGRPDRDRAGPAPPRARREPGAAGPAVAFVKRTYHPIVRLMRPELGLLPHRFARDKVAEHFWGLFADPDAIDPSVADVVVDEFQRIYASTGGRIAFLSAARNIYLEAPYGRNGFYGRLSQLEPPALFVWGSHDRVIPPAFGRHVARWLPSAEQIVLDGCGHVPQVERAAQTTGLLERFFARFDAWGPLPRQRHADGPRRLEAMDTETASRPSRNGHHAGSGPFAARTGARARRRRARRPGEPRARRRRARSTGSWARSRAACARGFPPPTSTSATRTSSARRCPPSGCWRASGFAARCAAWATSPRRARCCSWATTPAATCHLTRSSSPSPSARTSASSGAFTSSRTTSCCRCRGWAFCASTARSRRHRRTPTRALASGAALLVYPGGDVEVHRPTWEGNTVNFDGRRGFVRLALEHDVPIVPVVAIGGQETALFLSRGERVARRSCSTGSFASRCCRCRSPCRGA